MFGYVDREQLIKNLSKQGLQRVKERLKVTKSFQGNYRDRFENEMVPYVEAWIEEQENIESSKNKSLELKIANESNLIAKQAVDKASFANRIAICALIFTLLNFLYLLFFKK